MSYKSKRMIASTLAGILLIVAYTIYAVNKNASGAQSLSSWAITLLVFIAIGVGVMIVIQILFHIGYSIGIAVKDKDCDGDEIERIVNSLSVEDEMEKTINMKSSSIGYFIAGLGFIASLITLAFGASAVVMLHIMAGSFAGSMIIEGILSIYWYERGI